MENKNYTRRKFISRAAMSLWGYSLMVNTSASAESKAVVTPKGKEIDKVLQGIKFCSESEVYMDKKELTCDVFVAGGGMAGICAAIASARNGAKTILVQDRSRLGGNASSEIKMHPLGINSNLYGFREAGIQEEIYLENLATNPQNSWEIWDLLLYDKCVSEPNLTLILDTFVYSADTKNNLIDSVYARSDKTLTIYKIKAQNYIDCTGDSRLGMEAGAELMKGRDGQAKYGENEVVSEYPIGGLLCSSIMFTSKEYDKPMPFTAPSWAKKITAENLKFRDPRRTGFDYGYWFISHGGLSDTIKDNEVLRLELLATVLGVWDYVKNSGEFPETANRAIDTIGMIPGKRDSFRIKGKKLFSQFDIRGKWKDQQDSVGVVGWKLEDQPSGGFYDTKTPPAMPHKETPPFNLPLSIMVAEKIGNLMMAGRNMSCTHLAFSCTRVMKTGAVAGQAIGTAAAIAGISQLTAHELLASESKIKQVQQTILKDGQIIFGVENLDDLDLAKKAKISSSANALDTKPSNIVNGKFYDLKNQNANKWVSEIEQKPWLKLEWDNPQKISELILNFDAGSRHLTMTYETSMKKSILYAPQPEVLRDFDIIATHSDGSKSTILEMRNNFQKRVLCRFEPTSIKSLQVNCLNTNGDKYARIFEIRAYA